MARQFREYLVSIRPFLRADGFATPAMAANTAPAAMAPPIDETAIRKALPPAAPQVELRPDAGPGRSLHALRPILTVGRR
jgi:hypothetical protein